MSIRRLIFPVILVSLFLSLSGTCWTAHAQAVDPEPEAEQQSPPLPFDPDALLKPSSGPSPSPTPATKKQQLRSTSSVRARNLSRAPVVRPNDAALEWDSKSKEYHAEAGEQEAPFTFNVTNVSDKVVSINGVRTSCGCTVAKLPKIPWPLQPGTNAQLNVKVNLRGKHGIITKMVVVSAEGRNTPLTVKVHIPTDPGGGNVMNNRVRNLRIAAADRQAVFKGDCASCHKEPTRGKMGQALYEAACGICHEAEHRATMVPDLHELEHPTGPDYWEQWVRLGKQGTLMPGFAQSEGGPLTEDQIGSLVEYLSETIPSGSGSTASVSPEPPLPRPE